MIPLCGPHKLHRSWDEYARYEYLGWAPTPLGFMVGPGLRALANEVKLHYSHSIHDFFYWCFGLDLSHDVIVDPRRQMDLWNVRVGDGHPLNRRRLMRRIEATDPVLGTQEMMFHAWYGDGRALSKQGFWMTIEDMSKERPVDWMIPKPLTRIGDGGLVKKTADASA